MTGRILIFIIALAFQSCVFSNYQTIKDDLILPDDGSREDQIAVSCLIASYPNDICELLDSAGYSIVHYFDFNYKLDMLIDFEKDNYYFDGIYYNNYFMENSNDNNINRFIRLKSDSRDTYLIFTFSLKFGKWYLSSIDSSVLQYKFR